MQRNRTSPQRNFDSLRRIRRGLDHAIIALSVGLVALMSAVVVVNVVG